MFSSLVVQSPQAARVSRFQITSTRGVRARARRVAGCATSNGLAGHAGAQAYIKLTFQLDHSVGPINLWTMRTEVWRYVTWEDLEDYLRLGWLPTPLPEPHGHYRCGCVWRCSCPCVEPQPARDLPATKVPNSQLIGNLEPHAPHNVTMTAPR